MASYRALNYKLNVKHPLLALHRAVALTPVDKELRIDHVIIGLSILALIVIEIVFVGFMIL
jgi:hypothetical protein